MDIRFNDHRVSTAVLNREADHIIEELFGKQRKLGVPKAKKAGNVPELRQLHEERRAKRGLYNEGLSKSLESLSLDLSGSSTNKQSVDSSVSVTAVNINNPHAVSHFLHKVSFVSGAQPGSKTEIISSKPELDKAEINTNANEVQLKYMRDSSLLQSIINQVFALHAEVNEVVKELYHRKDLALTIQNANSRYVQFFESVMSEMLLLQRTKFKSQSKNVNLLKSELAELKEKYIATKDVYEKEQLKASNAVSDSLAMNAAVKEKDNEISHLNDQIVILESEKKQLEAQVEAGKQALVEADRRRVELIEQVKSDMRNKYDNQLQITRKHLIKQIKEQTEKELKADFEEKLDKTRQSAKPSIDTTKIEFKRPKVDNSTQTEVDEYGIWDKQDGWNLPISGTIVARQQWRRALTFASCPSCKGNGKFIALCAKLLKQAQRGQCAVVQAEVDLKRKKAKWTVPDDLVQFMSNLPRSVQSKNPKNTLWILRKVANLLLKKQIAEEVDSSLGYAMQSATEFVIEAYLSHSKNRTEAELEMYVLTVTLREAHRTHPLLHTFARFLGFLDSYNDAELREAHKKTKIREVEEAIMKEKKLATFNPRERTKYMIEERERLREESKGKKTSSITIEVSNCSLSMTMMAVYLYARNCLLHPYYGIYATALKKIKSKSTLLRGFETRLNEDSDWPVTIPEHVCLCENYNFWIPVDRVLRVMRPMLIHLDDDEYAPVLRSIENNVKFLTSSCTLKNPEGMRSVVRVLVRRITFAASPDGRDLSWNQIIDMHKELNKPISDIDANFLRALGADDDSAIVLDVGKAEENASAMGDKDSAEYGESQMKKASVAQQFRDDIMLFNLDYALQLLVEVLLERSKYVEKSLEQIFIEGDENGDGVLNFKEFTTIVSKVAPHFHERRVLKMYREALMQGDDNETITQFAFVTVCKKHGLVQLVDMVTMKKTFLRALTSNDVTQADVEASKVLALTSGSALDYSFALPTEHSMDSPASTKDNLNALAPQGSVASLSPAKPGGRRLSSFVKSTIVAQNFFDSIKIKHQQQEILKQQQLQMQLLQQQMLQKPLNAPVQEEKEEGSEDGEDVTETNALAEIVTVPPSVALSVEDEKVPDTIQYRVGLAKNVALSSSIKDKIKSSLKQRKNVRKGHNEGFSDSDESL